MIFEGEYLNGLCSKGKLYNINGLLKFEGDFLNEKILKGNKFIYFSNGILRFKGKWEKEKNIIVIK